MNKLGQEYKKLSKELEAKDIVWKDPFGYVFKSTDNGEHAKGCTLKEVEIAVSEIGISKAREFLDCRGIVDESIFDTQNTEFPIEYILEEYYNERL